MYSLVCLTSKYVEISLDRDGTLSSPGGPGSIIHDPQPIRDRPVGGVGHFSTLRGEVSFLVINAFVSGLSEFNIND